jgi:hypothetical protein
MLMNVEMKTFDNRGLGFSAISRKNLDIDVINGVISIFYE